MLLEADKMHRLQLFGDDSWDVVSTIVQSFGVILREDDLAQATTIGAIRSASAQSRFTSAAALSLSGLVSLAQQSLPC